ncbi:phage tail sheath family protein [Burkholderia sp. R-69980]|nr:phage tail sheath family protein [Burkholderia sp. R-69980]
MPASPTYPGVYIVELPSPVHAITGVATSITAFVGYTATGIDNRAQAIYSFSDYERLFGGLANDSELSYAVQQFFANGGTQGYVVRVPHHQAKPASVDVIGADNVMLRFTALSSGSWANGELTVDVDYDGLDQTKDPSLFNLTVNDLTGNTVESFPQVSLNFNNTNYVVKVVNDFDTGSQFINVSDHTTQSNPPVPPTAAPAVSGLLGAKIDLSAITTGTSFKAFDYGVNLSVALPAGTSLKAFDVKLFAKSSAVPQTTAGIASQVQSAFGAALGVHWSNASIRCVATKNGADNALRVIISIPNYEDAVIAIAAPAGPGMTDASGPLGLSGATPNAAHYTLGTGNTPDKQTASVAGTDGPTAVPQLPTGDDLVGDPGSFTGIYALEKVDLFNLLVIPDATRSLPSDPSTLDTNATPVPVFSAAITYCQKRRAFLLVDPPPNVNNVSAAVDWKTSGIGVHQENGACFFPRLRLPDPVNNFQLRTFAPSGLVAGLFARIDGSRGVWKAPAGTEATLTGVQSLVYKLTDTENGVLNPLGVNCFRNFPIYGPVLWGSRTLVGADADTNQWKYVPVRRLALYMEESLYRGTQWAVFEPNDEPLWASLRLNIGSFMNGLFRKGAFQGQSPSAAYFVKCDNETTTQNDINNGVVNVLVGFAPLIPAEFVVIQIQQMAGQVQS